MRKHNGFTIVELLIVIVIIGVLAMISVVAYNGVSTNAKNVAKLHELKQWQKLFEVYRAQHGQFPSQLVVGQSYCLGKGFPVGVGGQARCRNYNMATDSYLQHDANSLMTELQTIGSLPEGDRTPIRGVVGPYVVVSSSGIDIIGIFHGSTCPDSTRNIWTSPDTIVSLCGSYIAS